ncbi:Homoserine/homoserine lactone efflux protein [Pseudovibrio axinellae]|uniref:Homoserine/homoserine lactone efflux protein n=1 Tax=Pseudovibrio axinellae TaxID=989403 RepID=A0A165YDT6_9HYPH|nr:LysE family translocator [Pseudovibrio axinellae]KZL18752.1 Homoserine/homoserine lactone efflux protein [Pseudovibrio axinellae]SEP94114.1 Threonine/homoserine/homoserine lactone efflux protein [Pseudovibrio axinellae]
MINISLYLGFIGTTFNLLAIPCSNIKMMLAKSTREGTAKGLSWVEHTYPDEFEIIQYGGPTYLIYLGAMRWVRAGKHDAVEKRGRDYLKIGFFVGISNPKSLLFMAAFFPQFIDKAYPPDPQPILMGITYIITAILTDGTVAFFGGYSRNLLSAPKAKLHLDRVSGVALVCAGVVLAFVH